MFSTQETHLLYNIVYLYVQIFLFNLKNHALIVVITFRDNKSRDEKIVIAKIILHKTDR